MLWSLNKWRNWEYTFEAMFWTCERRLKRIVLFIGPRKSEAAPTTEDENCGSDAGGDYTKKTASFATMEEPFIREKSCKSSMHCP